MSITIPTIPEQRREVLAKLRRYYPQFRWRMRLQTWSTLWGDSLWVAALVVRGGKEWASFSAYEAYRGVLLFRKMRRPDPKEMPSGRRRPTRKKNYYVLGRYVMTSLYFPFDPWDD